MPVLLTTVSPVLAEYLTHEAPHQYVLNEGRRKEGMQERAQLVWAVRVCDADWLLLVHTRENALPVGLLGSPGAEIRFSSQY